jgi:hypothetical protein
MNIGRSARSCPIDSAESLSAASKTIRVRVSQPVKHDTAMSSIDAGIQIDLRDLHQKKAARPIVRSRQPDSKVKLDSDSQRVKQQSEIVSIDAGMQIDRRPEQSPNPASPRIAIFDSGSNVRLERLLHQLKQEAEILSTDEGMETD